MVDCMVSRKKILITGCSGFIGRHTVRYALGHGYQVVGLDLRPLTIRHKNLTFFKGSINNRALVEKVTKGCGYVLHLAALASLPDFNKDLHANYTTNVVGFMNVIDAARKNKCKKFVYASSSGVYKDEFSEESVINVMTQRNHYGKSKLIDEMIADSYIDTHKMPVVGLRYFNIYGPGEEDKLRSSPITQFLMEKKRSDTITIFGDGKQSKDFTYIDDAVELSFRLLEDKKSLGLYNIGTGVTTNFLQIVKLMKPSKVIFTKNPYLSTYMFYLKADTKRILKAVKGYRFVKLSDGIKRVETAVNVYKGKTSDW